MVGRSVTIDQWCRDKPEHAHTLVWVWAWHITSHHDLNMHARQDDRHGHRVICIQVREFFSRHRAFRATPEVYSPRKEGVCCRDSIYLFRDC